MRAHTQGELTPVLDGSDLSSGPSFTIDTSNTNTVTLLLYLNRSAATDLSCTVKGGVASDACDYPQQELDVDASADPAPLSSKDRKWIKESISGDVYIQWNIPVSTPYTKFTFAGTSAGSSDLLTCRWVVGTY